MTELQALQNAASQCGLTVTEKYTQDKRNTVKRYFLSMGKTTVSPVLDYEQMNCFLLGYNRGQNAVNPNPEDNDTISIKWGIEDVMGTAKEMGKRISKKAAREILGIIDRKHDATIGINWEVIQCHIDMYLDEKKEKSIAQAQG